jgi:hypothetical protein
MSLDYRPVLLSHQLFRETVPLRYNTVNIGTGKLFYPGEGIYVGAETYYRGSLTKKVQLFQGF